MGIFRRRPTVDPTQLAAVASEVAALRAQLATIDARLDAAGADQEWVKETLQVAVQRVASIGTELTNQLTELSGDIDMLAARPDPTEAIGAVAELKVDQARLAGDQVRLADGHDRIADGQDRLANEQARYQIAFREDLAALADQVHRRRG